MKAIQKTAPQSGFVLAELPTPPFGPDEVLIKVSYASICGTDVHITQWDDWSSSRIKPPLVYGHEFCGVIEAVGTNVTHLKPGQLVSAEMHIPCGVCHACMIGKRHICENVKIAGIDLDGCYAGYVVLPKNQIVVIPPSVSPQFGACLDSLGNAVHAVSKGDVSGKAVLVTGCGPVGLFSVAVAKALGATQVFATDVSEYRLNLAEKMGATMALRADQTDVVQTVLDKTQQRGVDVVLEMSGHPSALKNGFQSLSQGGTMVLLGIPKSNVELDLTNDIIFKEAKVLGIHGREMFQTWFLMLDLLDSGRLNIAEIITHEFPLAQFGEAMELVASGHCGKVLLKP